VLHAKSFFPWKVVPAVERWRGRAKVPRTVARLYGDICLQYVSRSLITVLKNSPTVTVNDGNLLRGLHGGFMWQRDIDYDSFFCP